MSALLRQTVASSSKCVARPTGVRLLSSTRARYDLMREVENNLNSKEVIEKKRREFEAKYGDKLKKRVETEGVPDLEALKAKVMAPSVKQALKSKRSAKEYLEKQQARALKAEEEKLAAQQTPAVGKQARAVPTTEEEAAARLREEQAQGDRSGVKPLGSILNLPLLHLTPHTSDAISKIWTAYHTAHPTLSASFLSASLTTPTYNSMLSLAKANPFFVLPLPRPAAPVAPSSDATVKETVATDSYEMFYVQWLFHPTSRASLPPSPEDTPAPLPLTSSTIFTPLEEFKKHGEWAQPYLVMTHYPELSQTHDLVLMRGEITAAAAGGVPGSNENPGFLLSQQQAQLLVLALQRFYCTGVEVRNESEKGKVERLQRAQALIDFREKPEQWDWKGLIDMAYGGMV